MKIEKIDFFYFSKFLAKYGEFGIATNFYIIFPIYGEFLPVDPGYACD